MVRQRLWQQLLGVSLLAVMLLGCAVHAASISVDTEVLSEQAAAGTLPADLTVAAVHALYSSGEAMIVDVREESEYTAGHIPGATLIPLGELPNRLAEVPTDQPVVVVCRSGNRSGQAADFLREQGFTNVHNMLEGMNAWSSAGYDVEQ